jgi:hypothetical protein
MKSGIGSLGSMKIDEPIAPAPKPLGLKPNLSSQVSLKKLTTLNKAEEIPILRAPTGKKPNFMMKKADKPKPNYSALNQINRDLPPPPVEKKPSTIKQSENYTDNWGSLGDKTGTAMEEEVLSDENSIKDGSYNLLNAKSSKLDNSYKETITVTDTDNDKSVPGNKRQIP